MKLCAFRYVVKKPGGYRWELGDDKCLQKSLIGRAGKDDRSVVRLTKACKRLAVEGKRPSRCSYHKPWDIRKACGHVYTEDGSGPLYCKLSEWYPTAHTGVFTRVYIKEGDYITTYDGVHQSVEPPYPDALYTVPVQVHKGSIFYIVGHKTLVVGKGYGSQVNGGKKEDDTMNCENVSAFMHETNEVKLLLRATRDINKHEELFADYGDDYWVENKDELVNLKA